MAAPRLALWGTFDVDNYGDHLFPRVAVHELRRRLPDAAVDAYAPYGRLHSTPLDDGPISPLGPWSRRRAAQLAGAYDTVVIGGGEIIHLNDPLLAPVYGASAGELVRMAPSRFFVEALGPELERRCPVVWHAVGVSVEPVEPEAEVAQRLRAALAGRPYIAVRDRFSKERLERAGVERPIEVVPDSALLVDRVLPAPALAARLERLRSAGCYPTGPALVLQGCDLIVPHAAGLARAVGEWLDRQGVSSVAVRPRSVSVSQSVRPQSIRPPSVRPQRAGASVPRLEPVIIETGRCRGDAVFADALQPQIDPRRVFRLPPEAGIDDLAAAIAGGFVFVGSSLHGAITALVYGRPFVLLNLAGESKLDGFGDLTGLGDLVVHDVDALAPALERAVTTPAPPGLLPDLQRRIDHHFDRIAEIALAAGSSRGDTAFRRLSRYRRLRVPQSRH
ncbi:MAG: polysaccharide pyruvyl transferase family protein [Actinomycetota bacterium]|nr:polysaccharide pyruvyl transferase family protein [Actinomycetota bacterium]